MNKIADRFLPIGTVVVLKNTNKKLMITGFCPGTNKGKYDYKDYEGCIFPEGILTTEKCYMFNHDDIINVLYMGYIDEEEKQFKSCLNGSMNIFDTFDLESNKKIN